MEFDNVILTRRSVRKFSSAPVPEEYIIELLEAARLAPSGLNIQPWRFVVVKDKSVREQLATATPSRMVAEAPLVIVCFVDNRTMGSVQTRINELQDVGAFAGTYFEGKSAEEFFANKNVNEFWIKSNLAFNAAIGIEHIVLKAVDLGLSSCWVGSFDLKRVRDIVEIDSQYDVIALLPIGYAEKMPTQRPRLSMDEIVLKVI